MTDTEVKATVAREQRTDRAERTLTLEGAPPFSYETEISYRNRKLKTVQWVATHVRLTWDRGVLKTVWVSGVKLKADGTPGQLKASATFPVDKYGEPSAGHQSGQSYRAALTPPPHWLLQVVAAHREVPPFKALDQVGA